MLFPILCLGTKLKSLRVEWNHVTNEVYLRGESLILQASKLEATVTNLWK
jgi:hypothetical protein